MDMSVKDCINAIREMKGRADQETLAEMQMHCPVFTWYAVQMYVTPLWCISGEKTSFCLYYGSHLAVHKWKMVHGNAPHCTIT